MSRPPTRIYYEDRIRTYKALGELAGLASPILLDACAIIEELAPRNESIEAYVRDHLPQLRLRLYQATSLLNGENPFLVLRPIFGEVYGNLRGAMKSSNGAVDEEALPFKRALARCRRKASRSGFGWKYREALGEAAALLARMDDRGEPEGISTNDALLVVASRSLAGRGETVVASGDQDVRWGLETLHERREYFTDQYPAVFGTALLAAEPPIIYVQESKLPPEFFFRRARAAATAAAPASRPS